MKTWAGAAAILLVLTAVSASGAEGRSRLADRLPGKVDTGQSITLQADVKCSPDEVFRLWATSDGAEAMFAPRAQIEPRVGGRYTVAFFPNDDPEGRRYGTAGARILAREPPRFLAFEWVTFAADREKGQNAPPFAEPALHHPKVLPTWVEVGIRPRLGGAHVDLRHFGFGDEPLWRESRDWFARAWTGVIQSLVARCAGG